MNQKAQAALLMGINLALPGLTYTGYIGLNQKVIPQDYHWWYISLAGALIGIVITLYGLNFNHKELPQIIAGNIAIIVITGLGMPVVYTIFGENVAGIIPALFILMMMILAALYWLFFIRERETTN